MSWSVDETKRVERIEQALKRAGYPVTKEKAEPPATPPATPATPG